MKKILSVILLGLLTVFLAGCGESLPPNVVNTLDDVRGRNIGAISGTPSERVADELGVAWAYEGTDELMFHLRNGTLDCVIMESTVAAELVAETAGVRILSEPLLVYELRFAIALENRELLRAVNGALDTLRQDGTLRGFSDMYFAGRPFTYVPPEDVPARPGYLSLAVSGNSPPFSFRDVYGELRGLDIEVARAVSDLIGVELRIIEYDSWELIRAVRYGRADFALGWLPDEVEEELINISEPYAVAEHVVIVRR